MLRGIRVDYVESQCLWKTMYYVQTNEPEPWKSFSLHRIHYDKNYSQFSLGSHTYQHMTQQDLETQTIILQALPSNLRKLLGGLKLKSVHQDQSQTTYVVNTFEPDPWRSFFIHKNW